MRTSDIALPVVLLCLGFGFGPMAAYGLDLKSRADSVPAIPGVGPVGTPSPLSPHNECNDYYCPLTRRDVEGAVRILEKAFRDGDVSAGWRVAHNYADGLNGVRKDPARAFEIFQAIVESQHGSIPAGPSKIFVADALVKMGRYYLTGIPNSPIQAEPTRAFHQFYQAAINYASPEAQYLLARAYMDGQGTPKNPALAVKWFFEAANKDNFEAQAAVGLLLAIGFAPFLEQDVPRGLMWLKRAMETAPQAAEPAIKEMYDTIWKRATERERIAAMELIEKRRHQDAPSLEPLPSEARSPG
jgi:TPR repeat protein